MNERMRSATAVGGLMVLLLTLGVAPVRAQQNRIELPSGLPGIGEAAEGLRSDLEKLNAYNASVEERVQTRRNTRDPFQTTPELRARSGRSGFAPMAVGGGGVDGEELVWRVQALALGNNPHAVLVQERRGGGNARAAGGAQQGAREQRQQRFVRMGDEVEMDDGRLFKVERIDRMGVLLVSDGVEEEQMRIQ